MAHTVRELDAGVLTARELDAIIKGDQAFDAWTRKK